MNRMDLGVVTDVHYSKQREDRGNRQYRASRDKFERAVQDFRDADVDMFVSLGDIIDGDIYSYDDLEALLDTLDVPVYSVMGNHDYLDVSGSPVLEQVKAKLGVSEKPFSVRYKTYRLYFLNSNTESLQACGRDCIMAQIYRHRLGTEFRDWNGAMGKRQLKWLDRRLFFSDLLGERAVCFAHMPIVPEGNRFSQWDASQTAAVLLKHKSVRAYICGHHHEGRFSLIGGRIPHIMLQGMIEGPDDHHSIISFSRDSIRVIGKGAQPSASFPAR